ncbi:MAG: transglycosylase domain-containing protein [bacterium]
MQRGRYVYGGSTLPQQLVKNLFLARDKTLARKLQEAIIANRVTVVVPPERILALYINCIEFAPGVYSLRRAAAHYFGIAPGAAPSRPSSSPPPSPRPPTPTRSASAATPRHPHYRRYMRRLFDRLVEIGALTEADVQAEGPLQVTF